MNADIASFLRGFTVLQMELRSQGEVIMAHVHPYMRRNLEDQDIFYKKMIPHTPRASLEKAVSTLQTGLSQLEGFFATKEDKVHYKTLHKLVQEPLSEAQLRSLSDADLQARVTEIMEEVIRLEKSIDKFSLHGMLPSNFLSDLHDNFGGWPLIDRSQRQLKIGLARTAFYNASPQAWDMAVPVLKQHSGIKYIPSSKQVRYTGAAAAALFVIGAGLTIKQFVDEQAIKDTQTAPSSESTGTALEAPLVEEAEEDTP